MSNVEGVKEGERKTCTHLNVVRRRFSPCSPVFRRCHIVASRRRHLAILHLARSLDQGSVLVLLFSKLFFLDGRNCRCD